MNAPIKSLGCFGHLGCCACLVLLCLTASVQAQRNLEEIPDPDPLLELAELEVHPDFEINLYAADPRIAKPIQMNFDPSGRLWVASSEVYPQIEPGQQATDKILLIEDQDHDGTADKTTVFKSGLLIPTGVEPGDGGAYVANSTELLHLKDTDGDGVADTERVMLSGFGTEDTHHILHSLRWGPEGLLYMNQSIYIHSHIETPYGVRRMNGGGVWHFRPETMELEAFTLGLVNPWGHAFDRFGQSFETDGAGGEGINYVFPGFVGMASPGAKREMQGLNPGKPKLCGLERVGGSHLPEDWQGKLITNDFRAHRVCVYEVTEDGSGFAARELPELIKTRHPAFRPIDCKLGPDGAIYIADWYNPIIQHGEVDFRDPRRDHTHGRIWRVKAKNRPLLPYKDLNRLKETELVELLLSDEPWWRHHARRVLKERGKKKVLPAIAAVRKAIPDAFRDQAELELLWVHQSLNDVNVDLLRKLLQNNDARIRAAATRVLYHWQDRVPDKLPMLQTLALDDHPRVRSEAAHALCRCKEPNAVLLALAALEKPTDRFLEFALEQAADMSQDVWLPAMQDGTLTLPKDPSVLLFALKAADSANAVPLLLDALPGWKSDPKATAQVMQLVASRGNAEELAHVFDLALATDNNDTRTMLLDALIEANQRRQLNPASDRDLLKTLLDSKTESVQAPAAELAGRWQLSGIAPRLTRIAKNNALQLATRRAAIRGLAALREKEILQELNDQKQKPQIRIAAVAGLNRLDQSAAAKAAAELLPQLTEADNPGRLVQAFLAQDGADAVLAAAIDSQKPMAPDVAKICIRTARTSGRDVQQLVTRLQEAGGLNEERKLSPAEQEQLLRDAKANGSAARGEQVYRRASLNCMKCHAIGGAGGTVGPELGSMGASAPPDYLLESLIDPGAKIKENYHSLIVATDEGEIITGVLVRETTDSLILRNADDEDVSIPLHAIELRKDGGSLMPAGLVNELTRNEIIDLLSFLSELGKVGGDHAVTNEPLVRSWESLDGDADATELAERTEAQIAQDPGLFRWQRVYSTVSGDLPTTELARHRARGSRRDAYFIRFPIEMTSAGSRMLRLANSGPGVRVFVDGKPHPSRPETTLELTQGTHTVVIVVDHTDASQPVRAILE